MSQTASVELQEKEVSTLKKILISQPEPANKNSPYHVLAEKYGLDLEFRPFIQVEQVPYKEFRKQGVDLKEVTAVIFTSRNAVDNFFRVCKDAKYEVPADMKYFCVSEQTATYLHKYITVRKRKVFIGGRTARDLLGVLEKHKNENFLYPCSDIRTGVVSNFLADKGFSYKEAVLYRTVSSDLSGMDIEGYDVIAFFSPSGVTSLFANFPEYEQKETKIAAFGPTTASAVKESGLILEIEAPKPNAPSMTGAIELYLKELKG